MLIIDLVLIIFPEGQLHVFAAEIGDLGSIPVSAASASPLAPPDQGCPCVFGFIDPTAVEEFAVNYSG